MLTLILSGLGQLYAGEPWRALAVHLGSVALLVGAILIVLPRTFPGLIVFVLAELSYRLWSMWDAARIARRKQDYEIQPYNRWYWYVVAVLILNVFLGPRLADLSSLETFKIPSSSMAPAVRIGDRLVADMAYYRSVRPSRGDLAIFVYPLDPNRQLLKRIVGLPGERIEIRDKVIYINGQRVEDPWGYYRRDQPAFRGSFPPGSQDPDNLAADTIPGDQVFVIGDDRDNSYDSRFYGPVPLSSLIGRPLYIYWSRDRSRIGTSLR